jgi:hypothetical protein
MKIIDISGRIASKRQQDLEIKLVEIARVIGFE